MSSSRIIRRAALLVAAFGILPLRATAAPADPGRELIHDPHFQCGFIVLDPKPGKRVPYGLVPGHARGAKPVWDLAQWTSKHPLAIGSPQSLASGALCYSNAAKILTLGKPGADDADLSLAVNASVEYGQRARQDGEPWVHLLLQQDLENSPALAELGTAQLHVEARLKSSKKIGTPDYSPSRHAAQFQTLRENRGGIRELAPAFGWRLPKNRSMADGGRSSCDAGGKPWLEAGLAGARPSMASGS